ncbi:hypothetical protein [Pseudomonas vancouverensis]|uniref:hypothetical protein n=1 Tax=Pseudomonas vancouverensis TaxID=95300 RepID=UPI0012FE4628|nr:hypothetical protein [Pseudomonas vancouverensis]
MSTNFTIWAIIFSVAAVDVAHYTERVLICKPLILKINKSEAQNAKNPLSRVFV